MADLATVEKVNALDCGTVASRTIGGVVSVSGSILYGNCLEPKREIPSDYSDPLTWELVRKFNVKSCDETRKNVRIVHEALAAAWSKNCADPSNVELIWQHTGLKEGGQLCLSVPEHGVNLPSECAVNSSLSSTTRLEPPPTLLPEEHKVYIAEKIAREKKGQHASLQLDCLGLNNNNLPKTQLITRLCSLISQKEWDGYLLHTDTAEEMIIHMKKVISPSPMFSSLPLESVISDHYFTSGKGKQVAHIRLSRKERLGIAAAVVWAVLVLCGTPWLEEGWLGKEDITLLIDPPIQEKTFGRPKTYPTLSHTFMSQKEPSEPLGSFHPDRYFETQIRHKTLFALGVLLIELGLNKTLNQLRRDMNTEVCETSVQDAYMTANQVIESQEIELELGESYANAVQRCIQCHFLGPASTLNFLYSGFRNQFFTKVVAPVQATFDAQITSVKSH
ncbi:hypothetical protein GQX73_g3001 [Xylaria multiplex]|uniref:DUF7580 domain-containing protein n=1 Tax=Xylaria multiplex TaxID=323545 RepID=A0A7C8IUH0_9PEZI|nr:hypothetical protein GQX73_g3001 [Xylaria multiplex]